MSQDSMQVENAAYCQVRMLERLFYCNAAFGTEGEAFFHQIDSEWICLCKHISEIDSLPERERT